jgi:hypothetical protein
VGELEAAAAQRPEAGKGNRPGGSARSRTEKTHDDH